jgi:hypothetical protein
VKNLDDLINYEKEYTSLDFKSTQYDKGKHEALIKDIMSMANADVDGDRYIIIGVDYKNSNDRDLVGINKEDFIDSAIYQQLIIANIEPQINFDYFSHEINGICFGVFRIINCDNQPYMMKKDQKNLKKGQSFIRKGDSQFPFTREDLDRIIAKKVGLKKFNGKVNIYFSGSAQSHEIVLPVAYEIELPSEKAAKKIRAIIAKKSLSQQQSEQFSYSKYIPPISFLGTPTTYEQRSIEELERNLADVKETYKEDDDYEFFELRSHKLNITIINEGDEYIEDVTFQIDIDKVDGLLVLDKIFKKPEHNRAFSLNVSDFELGYPEVECNESFIRITQSKKGLLSWNIKHNIPEEVFIKPLRILLLENLAGETLELKCKLYGKNLKEPIEEILKIKVGSK